MANPTGVPDPRPERFYSGTRYDLEAPVANISRDIKRGIIEAAVRLGRDGKGTDGLLGYLMYLGERHPKEFCGLLSKMIPLKLDGDGLINLVGAINIVPVPTDRYLTADEVSRLERRRLPAMATPEMTTVELGEVSTGG